VSVTWFEFCDDFWSPRVRLQYVQQTMRRGAFSNFERVLAKPADGRIALHPRYLLALLREDLGEKISAHRSRFVSRIKASSFDVARPLSMLSRARLVAWRRLDASPEM